MSNARSVTNVESSFIHLDVVIIVGFVVKSFAVGVAMKLFRGIKLDTLVK